jgi:hypothetical protein
LPPIAVPGVKKDPNGVTFTMSPGKMKLAVCSDSIVRVMYAPHISKNQLLRWACEVFATPTAGDDNDPSPVRLFTLATKLN